MRRRRIYGSKEGSVYHCVSRVVNGEMLLGVKEKEVLRKMIRQAVEFSGVELLTYVVMGNHFHVLVRVSERAREVSDAELLRRYKVLYPKPNKYQTADIVAVEAALQENADEGQAIRKKLTVRMGDISEFMRTVKQRFSIWYNKSHRRYGPLWADRFKSVVVENEPVVVKTVAAYIDLNPVRAGLVEDPKDYRFCGYAEALSGDTMMRSGLRAVIAHTDFSKVLSDYRMLLFGKGARRKPDGRSGKTMTEDASHKVMNDRGTLPQHVVLRQRIRYFTDGAVIGTSLFVDKLIDEWSPRIGDRRKRVNHSIKGVNGISSFRKVRLNA